MDVVFANNTGRRRPLDFDIVKEFLKDRSQSDLDISEEERDPAISVPRLLDEDMSVHDQPRDFESDSGSDSNIPLTELLTLDQKNIPPPPVNPSTSEITRRLTTQKKSSRIRKAANFTDIPHNYFSPPVPREVKTPMQY
ncbi:unnamed protein product, partial [Brenthis ino]